ncbi:MAG: cyclic nucleotide-binding domain-containing protein [Pseudomonadota bacterium]|uniref:Cyclic nucleotide-binding domain-containing protein n=1 Tax=Candidatus Desulfatibia profunda TaxID=2841695 RepID=A0A8J6TGL8_9BACT|nr:cyclic nucleotide-binding domain-containing protein [Candidatus Desulfatibia profunda]MBL7180344.1 cyclic nucleotide-binding domain-containing protein [Desulfobacterales bacterium]
MNAIEHFKKNSLFDKMDGDEKKRIMEKFQKITLSSGEYIFRENDPGDTLYIVEEGTVSLKKLIINDYEKTLFVATEGLVFGEFSFIDGKERSASAFAEKDSVLLSLKREDFDTFIKEHPLSGAKLYDNLLSTIVKRLRLTNEAYRDAIRWGIEATGAVTLNFQNIITENINIRVELKNSRILEGRILQLEQSDAGYELVIADQSGALTLVPYHAINSVSVP